MVKKHHITLAKELSQDLKPDCSQSLERNKKGRQGYLIEIRRRCPLGTLKPRDDLVNICG